MWPTQTNTMSSGPDQPRHTRIAIFASGTGSNALKILETFQDHPTIKVGLVVSNNPDAGVLKHAHAFHTPALVITRRLLNDEEFMTTILDDQRIDVIVLAGFMLLIPSYLVKRYPNRIVNIHPALLPKFGGKGMYGMHVHRAVKEAGEAVSGISIHYVNEHYDEGQLIAQYEVGLDPGDSPESIARKVQVLEHKYYPVEIERVIQALPAKADPRIDT